MEAQEGKDGVEDAPVEGRGRVAMVAITARWHMSWCCTMAAVP